MDHENIYDSIIIIMQIVVHKKQEDNGDPTQTTDDHRVAKSRPLQNRHGKITSHACRSTAQ